MILLCIAIHGDNERLGREYLKTLLDQLDGTSVYRAWTTTPDRDQIDEFLQRAPKEVKR